MNAKVVVTHNHGTVVRMRHFIDGREVSAKAYEDAVDGALLLANATGQTMFTSDDLEPVRDFVSPPGVYLRRSEIIPNQTIPEGQSGFPRCRSCGDKIKNEACWEVTETKPEGVDTYHVHDDGGCWDRAQNQMRPYDPAR